MDNKWSILSQRPIQESYEFVGQYEIWIDNQKISIKITKNRNGEFFHSSSHHYKGSNLAGTYITSENGLGSLEEALQSAVREKTFFYDPNDNGREWIKNEDF